MHKPTVIILRGMPGSGKSTLARSWAALDPNTMIVSVDDYFTFGRFYIFAQRNVERHLRAAQAECFERFQFLLKQGYSVIVDNINHKKQSYQKYLNYAHTHDYQVRVVEIPCPDLATAYKFNERSKRQDPKWRANDRFKKWQVDPDAEIVNLSS